MTIHFLHTQPRLSVERMTRDELNQHARRGRVEDLEAAREKLIRWRRRMGERPPWDASNVVPFPRSNSDTGGVS